MKKVKLIALILSLTMGINIFAAENATKANGTMNLYDQINASKFGNCVVKINGQYIIGTGDTQFLYFPGSIDNAYKNWNMRLKSEDELKTFKETFERDYNENDDKSDSRCFGIRLNYFDDREFYEQYGDDYTYQMPQNVYWKSSIYAYKNTIYSFTGNDVIVPGFITKFNLDLNEVKRQAIRNYNKDDRLIKWYTYYFGDQKENEIEIKGLIYISDSVRIGNKVYYLVTREWNRMELIPMELWEFNLENEEDKLIYKADKVNQNVPPNLATDGSYLYFYSDKPQNGKNEIVIKRYLPSEKRFSDYMKPKKTFYFEEKTMDWISIGGIGGPSPYNVIGYEQMDNYYLEFQLVKRLCSQKAWDLIQKQYNLKHDGWYLDKNSIYFTVDLENNNARRDIVSYNLKTGQISINIKNSYAIFKEDGHSETKANSIDDYIFFVDSYYTSIINQKTKKRYDMLWGFYKGY